MPISGKEMRKLFYKAGYELVSGAGKGSHWKLAKGNETVIIPRGCTQIMIGRIRDYFLSISSHL